MTEQDEQVADWYRDLKVTNHKHHYLDLEREVVRDDRCPRLAANCPVCQEAIGLIKAGLWNSHPEAV